MNIKNTLCGVVALASTSFAQFAPDFQYGCQDPNNLDSLRLYAHWDNSIQQSGTDNIVFTLTRLDSSVYPPRVVYPGTGVLFYSDQGSYAGVPFGGDRLCISRQATPMLWIRNEQLYSHPVYLSSFMDGVLDTTHYFQVWNRAENGGFELSNMVSVTM